ncbi:MAG TPA: DsbA family protein, partial [Acidimicrobiales bacterium]|nr:DsbA family protein [Acidimicrobiales bacterium]
MAKRFSVTWDYLCPFARNAHEHLVTALRAGADWDVRFRFFSLSQVHVGEGQPSVWKDPYQYPGLLAGLAAVVVRERHPEHFLDAHLALFSARFDRGLDLRDPQIVTSELEEVGLDAKAVLAEIASGWPTEMAQAEHDEAVQRWAVFGVPTFIFGDRAVFVRLMHRPGGGAEIAKSAIGRVLALVEGFP